MIHDYLQLTEKQIEYIRAIERSYDPKTFAILAQPDALGYMHLVVVTAEQARRIEKIAKEETK